MLEIHLKKNHETVLDWYVISDSKEKHFVHTFCLYAKFWSINHGIRSHHFHGYIIFRRTVI